MFNASSQPSAITLTSCTKHQDKLKDYTGGSGRCTTAVTAQTSSSGPPQVTPGIGCYKEKWHCIVLKEES